MGILLVLAAAVAWSLGGLGIKLITPGGSADGVAAGLCIGGWRSVFALPVLLVAIGPSITRANASSSLRSGWVWGAAISYAVTVVSFAMATRLTTAATAILLQYTGPVYVATLSGPLLGERPAKKDLLAVAGGLLGLALFSFEDLGLNGRLGMGLALLSGLGFGLLPLMLRRQIQERSGASDAGDPSPRVALLLGNLIAALGTLPWVIGHAPTDPTSWAVLFGLGTVQIACAYLFYAAGLRRLRAVEAALLCVIEPVLNPLWVALVTGEIPGLLTIIGGAVLLGTVVVRAAIPDKKP